MPNRIIKESICTSDNLNTLTWFEEVLFYRLIVNCDDYGRFDARTAILKGRLFPLKTSITEKSIGEALSSLATANLVALYEYEGRPFLQLLTWKNHQQIRAKNSKFPGLEDECAILLSSDRKCTRETRIEKRESILEKRDACADALLGFEGELREKVSEWLRYKAERKEDYKPTGLKSFVTEVQNKRKHYSDGEICALLGECMSNGWKGIIWDKLRQSEPARGKACPSGASSYDIDEIEQRLLHSQPKLV